MGAGRSGIFFFHNVVVLQMLRLIIELELTTLALPRPTPLGSIESNLCSIVNLDNLPIAMNLINSS